MKKLLLSFLSLLMVFAYAQAEEADPILSMKFDGTTTYSQFVNNYTSSFTYTDPSNITWNIANINNGAEKNRIAYLGIGTKTNASTSTMTSGSPISSSIGKIIITYSAVTATYVDSVNLYVSETSTFPTNPSYTASKPTTNNLVSEFNITNPKGNLYYKFEFKCKSGCSSNGILKMTGIKFYEYVPSTTDVEPISVTADNAGVEEADGAWVYPYGTKLTFATATDGAEMVGESDGADLIENEDGSLSLIITEETYVYINATKEGLKGAEYEGTFKVKPAVDPVVTFDDVTIMEGASVDITGKYPEELTMIYTSSDENIVKVENGKLVAVGAVGENATITASWDAVEHVYNAGSKVFSVVILEKSTIDNIAIDNIAKSTFADLSTTYKWYTGEITCANISAYAYGQGNSDYFQLNSSKSVISAIINAKNGYLITKIVVNDNNSNGITVYTSEKAYDTETVNGSYESSSKLVKELTKTDNTCTFENPVRYIALKPGGSCQITKIEVYYIEDTTPVVQTSPNISFENESGGVEVGDTYVNHLINDNAVSVEYSSSDNTIATVDAKGKVTGISVGTAIITVVSEESAYFSSETKSYEISVYEYEKKYDDAVTFNFVNKEYGMTRMEGSDYLPVGVICNYHGVAIEALVKDKVRLYTADFRINKSGSIKISCQEGSKITSVEYTTAASSGTITKTENADGTYTLSVSGNATGAGIIQTLTVIYEAVPVVTSTTTSTVNGIEVEVPAEVENPVYHYGVSSSASEEPTEWNNELGSVATYADILEGESDDEGQHYTIKAGTYYIWYYVSAEGYADSEKKCVEYTHAATSETGVKYSKLDSAIASQKGACYMVVVYNHNGKYYAMGEGGKATPISINGDSFMAFEHQFENITEFRHEEGALTPKAGVAKKASRSMGDGNHTLSDGKVMYNDAEVGFVPAATADDDHQFSTAAESLKDGMMLFATATDQNTGVDNVAVDGEDAEVEYYNLQGVRVANPGHGLYIKRQGGNAVKVVM